jgi:hypothetical protein
VYFIASIPATFFLYKSNSYDNVVARCNMQNVKEQHQGFQRGPPP